MIKITVGKDSTTVHMEGSSKDLFNEFFAMINGVYEAAAKQENKELSNSIKKALLDKEFLKAVLAETNEEKEEIVKNLLLEKLEKTKEELEKMLSSVKKDEFKS